MCRSLLAFYKTNVVPMVRGNFERVRFPLDLGNIRNPAQIDPRRALARNAVSNFELADSFIYPDQMRKKVDGKNATPKGLPAAKPGEFTVGLAADIQRAAGTCPLCSGEEEAGNDREVTATKAIPFPPPFEWLL